MWVAGFPAIHPRTHLVFRLRGRRTDLGSHPVRIRFLDPDGAELFGGDGTVHLGEPPAGVTELEAATVLAFDVPLPRPGRYRFEIAVDGAPVGEVALTASLAPAGGDN